MSVVFNLVTKYRDEDNDIYSDLSKAFTTFLASKIMMHDNSEFIQIENLLSIDLGLLLTIRKNMSPETSELEHQLRLAEEGKNDTKVERIKSEIKEIEREWKKDYDRDTEGWIAIPKLKKSVELLLGKISEYPNYYEKMQFNTNWGEYFYSNSSISDHNVTNLARTGNTFINDLRKIISYLEKVETLGCKYVAFY